MIQKNSIRLVHAKLLTPRTVNFTTKHWCKVAAPVHIVDVSCDILCIPKCAGTGNSQERHLEQKLLIGGRSLYK
jgi:hypothetical protein